MSKQYRVGEIILHGLIIKSPYVEKVLLGEKTWEIRGTKTSRRGKIALIKKGSKQVVGTCEVIDVLGPLSLDDMLDTHNHCIDHERLKTKGLHYKKTYAWVLDNVEILDIPIPYEHPRGAIIWVNLEDRLAPGYILK